MVYRPVKIFSGERASVARAYFEIVRKAKEQGNGIVLLKDEANPRAIELVWGPDQDFLTITQSARNMLTDISRQMSQEEYLQKKPNGGGGKYALSPGNRWVDFEEFLNSNPDYGLADAMPELAQMGVKLQASEAIRATLKERGKKIYSLNYVMTNYPRAEAERVVSAIFDDMEDGDEQAGLFFLPTKIFKNNQVFEGVEGLKAILERIDEEEDMDEIEEEDE